MAGSRPEPSAIVVLGEEWKCAFARMGRSASIWFRSLDFATNLDDRALPRQSIVSAWLEDESDERRAHAVSGLGPAVRPREKPSGASEHAGRAAQHGRAEQEADEPMQDQETEPDDASSRDSVDWEEGQSHDGPTVDEMSGGEKSSSADERPDRGDAHFDHLGAIGFALA